MVWDGVKLNEGEAALWFLGQAGYFMKSGGVTLMIDPYLSDGAGNSTDNKFGRTYPVPVEPSEIAADIFIATHDHSDHLDPVTLAAYRHTDSTIFVSPRNAAKKLAKLGVPEKNIVVIDHGDEKTIKGIKIEGVFVLATSADVLDTCGYKITFANGKSVCHTSDSAYCKLLLEACPYADVLLTCINGKFGNLNVAEAVKLTAAVKPKYAIPNHYDVMALNSENPETFKYFCEAANIESEIVILKTLETFVW